MRVIQPTNRWIGPERRAGKARDLLFVAVVFTLMFEYQLSFVHTYFVDRIIKLVAWSIVIFVFGTLKDNAECAHVRRVTVFYVVLGCIMVVSTALNLSTPSISYLGRYSLFVLFALVLLYKCPAPTQSGIPITFALAAAAALALNSLVLWVLVTVGMAPEGTAMLSERFSRITTFSYLWGDMVYATQSFFRACGFFETPNRFGNFMIFPAFVSFGRFLERKRIGYLLLSAMCFAVIVSTLALTILLASITAIAVGALFRIASRDRVLRKAPLGVGIVGLCLGVLLMLAVMQFYSAKYDETRDPMFRGGEYRTIFHSFVVSGDEFAFDPAKPFGVGLAYYRDGKYYTAQYGLLLWVHLLGYPGALFFLVFIAYMFTTHVFPALIARGNTGERFLAMAFFAQTLCEFQEGSWLSLNYLFSMAMLVLYRVPARSQGSGREPPQNRPHGEVRRANQAHLVANTAYR